jgi:hypothetical protein
MTDFGYYRLYDNGRIASGMHIEAPDLPSTIAAAQGRSDKHPTGKRRHVETWREQARVRISRVGWRAFFAGVVFANGSIS